MRSNFERAKHWLVDAIGPLVYNRYVPFALQIPLHETARHLGIPMTTLAEAWIGAGLLRVRTQFGGQPFTTKVDVEIAINTLLGTPARHNT